MTLSYMSSVEIDTPPERVFAAITDLDQIRRWMPNLVALEALKPGPVKVGSEWRETRKMMGHQASEVFEVTSLDPPRQIGLRVDGTKGTTGKGVYLFEYRLEPTGGGTRLSLDGHVVMAKAGFLTRLLGKLMIGAFKKACTKVMQARMAFVETDARAGS